MTDIGDFIHPENKCAFAELALRHQHLSVILRLCLSSRFLSNASTSNDISAIQRICIRHTGFPGACPLGGSLYAHEAPLQPSLQVECNFSSQNRAALRLWPMTNTAMLDFLLSCHEKSDAGCAPKLAVNYEHSGFRCPPDLCITYFGSCCQNIDMSQPCAVNCTIWISGYPIIIVTHASNRRDLSARSSCCPRPLSGLQSDLTVSYSLYPETTKPSFYCLPVFLVYSRETELSLYGTHMWQALTSHALTYDSAWMTLIHSHSENLDEMTDF